MPRSKQIIHEYIKPDGKVWLIDHRWGNISSISWFEKVHFFVSLSINVIREILFFNSFECYESFVDIHFKVRPSKIPYGFQHTKR